ncbi:hypothetical protein M2459_002870 [Parabacteroides sp. PF5-5]|uniref:FimB/Mfa2 family fimbrial subunit n=1 Tax=unclassified Parabacteroides TaxID=2649774 RepID=UPI0024740640|nr:MULTISPECIES: FimB/Mfa2 family fimbrial subunit [unclassified Parabacteroides]MDH6306156.1 hypothetical protein [Parabacteroides sp. PH5-39]MDH6317115.1 hypothetical protein [Parabacteroides sp. PF5-13]MDH6320868.1 hypothetical protein [Parabacteroides sp. PH5-13]MDH6324599.1 hypothetical protein [Parabacteroides sp. PH5-8]MDH6328350.1 hypothetical protein [Parabacteroides sp. PH5-41]
MRLKKNKILTKIATPLCVAIILVILLPGCMHDSLEECHGIRVSYRYFRDGAGNNLLGNYIRTTEVFIFDYDGKLLPDYPINGLPSELELPIGNYTIVVWGNRAASIPGGNMSKSGMLLKTKDGETEIKNAGDRLYYGYRSFSVGENGMTHINVDMVHAHAVMSLTIRWKSNPPENTGDFYLSLQEAPPASSFLPGTISKGLKWDVYSPGTDTYPQADLSSVSYFPKAIDNMTGPVYRQDTHINVDKNVKATFITFRYSNTSPLILSLYGGGRLLMKEIALERFFRESGINLENNTRQEFDLDVLIDGDKVEVSLAGENDWDEGGVVF